MTHLPMRGLLFSSLAALLCQTASAQPLPQPEPEAPEQPAAQSEDDMAAARTHFASGKRAHDAGNYSLASEQYLKAYELYPQPLFLYNVAQVKRLSGDGEGAVIYYEKYLALDPNGPGANNSRQLLGELNKVIAARKAKQKRDAEQSTPEQLPPPVEVRAIDTKKPEAIVPVEIALPAPPQAHPGRGLKIAGIASASVGILALGISGYYGSQAKSKQDELNGFQGVWSPAQERIYSDGESAQGRMLISASIGLGALLTGGVLYMLGSRKDGAVEQMSVVPSLGDGTTGLSLSGQF